MGAILLTFAVTLCLARSWAAADGLFRSSSPPLSQEAYVTLVYGEDFVLAARVLGQSLRESGSKKDMVALTTGSLSRDSEATLASDGWRVIHVPPVANPGQGPQPGRGYPSRFAYVYTKLYIFKMTEYKKIAFLDADVLVMRNMDAIFNCPGFCAALRHSERFNSGVMSLVPSREMYDDMMAKVTSMPSYTGGDQGFLNSYFSGFAHAPLFDPDTHYTPDQYKYMRLPTVFNADIGLFVVASNRWMLPRSSLYVMHFTLGPFKPWLWWSSWLVREDPTWQAVRSRLPRDTRHLPGGVTSRQMFAQRWMVALPWIMLLTVLYACSAALLPALVALLPGRWALAAGRSPRGGGGASSAAGGLVGGSGSGPAADPSAEVVLRLAVGGSGGASGGVGSGAGGAAGHVSVEDTRRVFPRFFTAKTLVAGYGIVGLATAATILIVPSEVDPLYGWILSYEWGFMFLAAGYGAFLRHCYRSGRRAGHHPALPHKGSAPVLPVSETASSATFLLVALLLAPWVGRLLRVNSFAGTIVGTVFVGLGVMVVATTHFVFLPARWYLAGRMAAGSARVL